MTAPAPSREEKERLFLVKLLRVFPREEAPRSKPNEVMAAAAAAGLGELEAVRFLLDWEDRGLWWVPGVLRSGLTSGPLATGVLTAAGFELAIYKAAELAHDMGSPPAAPPAPGGAA